MSQILRDEPDTDTMVRLFCAMVSKGDTILEEHRRNDTMDILPIYTRAAVVVTSILPSIHEGVVAGKVTAHLMDKFSDASKQASEALSELRKGATLRLCCHFGRGIGRGIHHRFGVALC